MTSTATLRKSKISARAATPGNRRNLAAVRTAKANEPVLDNRFNPAQARERAEQFVSVINEASTELANLYQGVSNGDFDNFAIDHKVASEMLSTLANIEGRALRLASFLRDGEYHLSKESLEAINDIRLAKIGIGEGLGIGCGQADPQTIINALLDKLDTVTASYNKVGNAIMSAGKESGIVNDDGEVLPF
jgi:hypothetical protein